MIGLSKKGDFHVPDKAATPCPYPTQSTHRRRQPNQAGSSGAGLWRECSGLRRAAVLAARERKTSWGRSGLSRPEGGDSSRRTSGKRSSAFRKSATNVWRRILHRLEVTAVLANLFLPRRKLLNA